jgi:hypothetical protein
MNRLSEGIGILITAEDFTVSADEAVVEEPERCSEYVKRRHRIRFYKGRRARASSRRRRH